MVFNSLKKFNVYNETNIKLKHEIKKIKKILKYAIKIEKLDKIYFNIIIIDNPTIKEMNKKYRSIDKETDVISFAWEDEKCDTIKGIRILGDIFISIDKAKDQAIAYEHSLDRELSFLAIHGFLHLLGYDHMNKKEEKIMIAKQELILSGKKFSKKQN